MPTGPRTIEEASMLAEAATAKLMTQCVLNNGPESNYATEKLMRVHRALVRALVLDLHLDPQQLIDTIERENGARG